MASKLEQKTHTRRQLLEAGMQLSATKGFGALSLREVSTTAGITPAGFYKHFRDMEELGLAMLDEVGLSLRQMLRDARKRVEPGPDAVRVSIEAFLRFINENQNHFRLLLGERQGASMAFRKAIHTEMDRFVAELAVDLERLQNSIEKPLADYAMAAEAIVAVMFTLGAEAIDLAKHKQAGLAARMVSHITTILRGSVKRDSMAPKPTVPKVRPTKSETTSVRSKRRR